MKKSIVAAAALITLAGGGYGANSYLVNEVATGIPKGVLDALNDIDKNVVHAQRVASSVEGSKVEETYRLYFTIDGKRQDDMPLYLTHKASVGIFGNQISGSFEVDKDKGIARAFEQEVTTFNEELSYVYSTLSQELDFDAVLSVGKINKSREYFEVGDISLNLVSTPSEVNVSANVPLIGFGERKMAMKIDDIVLNHSFDKETLAQQSTLNVGQFNFNDDRKKEWLKISEAQLSSSLSEGDSATLLANLAAKNISVRLGNLQPLDFDFNFDAKVDGIQSAMMEEFGQLAAHDNSYESRKRQEQLMRDILGAGMHAKDLTLKVNGSSMVGDIELKPFDYSKVSEHRMERTIASNLTSKILVVLDETTISNFPPLKGAVNQYFNQESDGTYSASFELLNGQPKLNGVPM